MAIMTPAAATPPITNCPSPPTLISPAFAGTVTARAARRIGAILMKISPMESGLAKVDRNISE